MPEACWKEGALTERRLGIATAVAPDSRRSFTAVDFYGRWDVRRVIVDHLSGAVHRFTGEAVISAADFVEAGNVRYGDVSLKAERRYVLRDGVDGIFDGIAVAFPDGRSFIRLDGRASQAVHHLCGTDDYRGRFFFRSCDAWVEAWRVTGPRKRYASLARYQRQAV
jgi:Family of unknown function (DUF6314)